MVEGTLEEGGVGGGGFASRGAKYGNHYTGTPFS